MRPDRYGIPADAELLARRSISVTAGVVLPRRLAEAAGSESATCDGTSRSRTEFCGSSGHRNDRTCSRPERVAQRRKRLHVHPTGRAGVEPCSTTDLESIRLPQPTACSSRGRTRTHSFSLNRRAPDQSSIPGIADALTDARALLPLQFSESQDREKGLEPLFTESESVVLPARRLPMRRVGIEPTCLLGKSQVLFLSSFRRETSHGSERTRTSTVTG